MEKSFRQTLIAEQGNIFAFVERPLSATFLGISINLFLLPFLKFFLSRKRAASVSSQS